MESVSDTSRDDQIVAFIMAHCAILAYLAKVVHTYVPDEGSREAIDATATMLRNSMPRLFAEWPEIRRSMAIAMAQDEIDRIFTAPPLAAGPGDR